MRATYAGQRPLSRVLAFDGDKLEYGLVGGTVDHPATSFVSLPADNQRQQPTSNNSHKCTWICLRKFENYAQ